MAHTDKHSPRRSIKVYARQLAEAKAMIVNEDLMYIQRTMAGHWFDDTLKALIKGQPLPIKPATLCQ